MIIEINKDLIDHYFLNEHDFHHYCYHAFYGKKGFSKQYLTRDGFHTNISHPEYPTLKRFKRKLIAVDLKCTRVGYDITIHGAVQ